ncbi:transmembrane protein 72-like [Mytilus galloprovincialis]|uniref:Transmembrane protein 72 n=1 Tax=Mytilus galloprovincialis TaxID=29158 RepID=A0A8B6DNP5_MYTGA|nr:Hypothetical predicted protein [Mytilus galloprovincialis]
MTCCGETFTNYGWDFFMWFCRFWGIITALSLWGTGVEAIYYGHILGYYITLAGLAVTFFELVFAMNYIVAVCQGDEESCCKNIWNAIVMVDNWKKGILYILFSVPCFIQPSTVWLGIISGVMLIISAILYMIKTKGSTEENELDKITQNASYDRFDELQEDDIEDCILNPTDQSTGISLAEQQEILEL